MSDLRALRRLAEDFRVEAREYVGTPNGNAIKQTLFSCAARLEAAVLAHPEPQLQQLNALLSEAANTDMLCDPTLDEPPCPECQALFEKFYAILLPESK